MKKQLVASLPALAVAPLLGAGGTVLAAAPASAAPAPARTEHVGHLITKDAQTGAILSDQVVPVSDGSVTNSLTISNPCATGAACYVTGQVPYANWGFSNGPGTETGNWVYRARFDSGNYHAKACWHQSASVDACIELTPGLSYSLGGMYTGYSVELFKN